MKVVWHKHRANCRRAVDSEEGLIDLITFVNRNSVLETCIQDEIINEQENFIFAASANYSVMSTTYNL
jgi:hypothetical protein